MKQPQSVFVNMTNGLELNFILSDSGTYVCNYVNYAKDEANLLLLLVPFIATSKDYETLVDFLGSDARVFPSLEIIS